MKPENIDINNMSRKELLEYAAQKGLTLTGTTELMRDRLRRILNRGVTLKSIAEFSSKLDYDGQAFVKTNTVQTRESLRAELSICSIAELQARCKKNNIQYRKREDAIEQILFKEYDFEHGHKAIRGEYAGGTNSRELAKAKAEYEEAQALRAQVLAEQEVRFEAERQEPTKTEPTKTELTDADFYIKTCTVDWDYIDIDMSQVDLRKAAELVRLATRTKAGIPVSIPVLIEYNAESDVKSVWRAVAKHTHAYAAIKLAKAWGSKDCTVEWGKHKPCEASGMVRVNTLNACSVGTGLGKEQPSAEYIENVLAMLD